MATATNSAIKKVAILFSGGPAPAANAVISTAAASFNQHGIEVIGMKYGYSGLMQFGPDYPLQENRDFIKLDSQRLQRTRNTGGIMIGTARENPGKGVDSPEAVRDPSKNGKLRTVYEGLCSLGVDALVSIGGDDTLRTANKIKLFQDTLPAGSKRIPVVHVPKTIDNDYNGIDFTFGFFTAVETMASEIRNLLADAEASRAYFIVESMGRSAGWLAYGAAIAGEASLVMSIEDLDDKMLTKETVTNPKTGATEVRTIMNMQEVAGKIVATMRHREDVKGKEFGVVVLAEGLAEFLPDDLVKNAKRDDFGHIAASTCDLGKRMAEYVAVEYTKQTGRKRNVKGLQLGYEVRCARPHAFDVILGSQLGVGAFRALVEEGHDGRLVSVSGQFKLHYVPFEDLVDPTTLVVVVRYIDRDSDFFKLARFLETNVIERTKLTGVGR